MHENREIPCPPIWLIARRFNERYCPDRPYFPEPDVLLSEAPLLFGVDGHKMGKSRGNAITLHASEDETAQLVRGAKTDAERIITFDPEGRPEVANLVLLAALCTERDPIEIADEIFASRQKYLEPIVSPQTSEEGR